MNRDQQQVQALAAVFQASVLADQLAEGTPAHPEHLRPLTASVLALNETDVEAVFPDPGGLEPGLQTLDTILRHGQVRTSRRPVTYTLGLLQLSRRLRKDADLTALLRERIETLQQQRPHFDDLAGTGFCHRLAGIYQDTLGTLPIRIQVQGQQAHLSNEDTAARIRALFLGGIRSAFLWHALGGRRRHLLTRRPRLVQALQETKNKI